MPRADESQSTTVYTISDLAREFNLTTRAIRFYEDQGLLNPQREGRKRIYTKRDRTRLRLILRGKRLGFTLSETRELFDLYDSARGEERQLRYFLKILVEHRSLLEQQQRDIKAALHEINTAEAECLRLLTVEKPWERSDQRNSQPALQRPWSNQDGESG